MKTFASVNVITESTYHCSGLVFQVRRYAADYRMPPHGHEQTCLVFGLQGTIKEAWKTQSFLRMPSTLILLPAHELHSNHFYEDVKTFHICLEPQWVERIRQFSPLNEAPAAYHNGLPTWHAMRLYREFQQRDNLTPLILEGLMLELLAEMSRHSTNVMESHCPRWLRQAKDLLHDQYLENLSIDTIAATVGVHPSHLMRGFRQYYHCTIGSYVRRLRIEYACHLLSTSNASSSQIAHIAGFADQSHFTRTFKSLTGLTPTRFQKLCGMQG